ncbi:WXG100 family type VII secretion target [Microbacterium hydrothermale]|uniref:WXG100 family type VII secretion target n=1 Tax=Microbacterium hydrothermale TaxID=857427 RepID=UPI0010A7A46B|nr:WXG100 family type VII secretion target [Microbacterium hydrothermale]
MTGLMVDFGAAHDSAARIAAAQTAIAGRLADLESAAQVLSRGWSGDAQAAYASAQAEWSAGMARLNGILDGVRQALDAWVSDMEQLEADLATGWPG